MKIFQNLSEYVHFRPSLKQKAVVFVCKIYHCTYVMEQLSEDQMNNGPQLCIQT